jgi:hypothetical protein
MLLFILSILFGVFVGISTVGGPTYGAEIYPHQSKHVFIVDNFEDKNLTRQPKWWGFGEMDVYIDENDPKQLKGLELYSMTMKGRRTRPRLVGGVGAFFGIDTRPYDAIKIPIKGYGAHSGIMIIELYDDDSNDWELTAHPQDPSQIIDDDKFIYNLPITWEGWKVVIIHLRDFKDSNPLFGDNIWNPYHTGTSGGLLQMQFLLFATDVKKKPMVTIDTIKFFNTKNIKTVQEKSEENFDTSDFY